LAANSLGKKNRGHHLATQWVGVDFQPPPDVQQGQRKSLVNKE
jgi:hypothetical protein